MAVIMRPVALCGAARQALLGLSSGSVHLSACVDLVSHEAQRRTFSDWLEDKGRGEENIRFRKEDERLLRQLLSKVKKAADSVDVHEAESSKSVDLTALKDILGKYNVSDEDLAKVLEWKHT